MDTHTQTNTHTHTHTHSYRHVHTDLFTHTRTHTHTQRETSLLAAACQRFRVQTQTRSHLQTHTASHTQWLLSNAWCPQSVLTHTHTHTHTQWEWGGGGCPITVPSVCFCESEMWSLINRTASILMRAILFHLFPVLLLNSLKFHFLFINTTQQINRVRGQCGGGGGHCTSLLLWFARLCKDGKLGCDMEWGGGGALWVGGVYKVQISPFFIHMLSKWRVTVHSVVDAAVWLRSASVGTTFSRGWIHIWRSSECSNSSAAAGSRHRSQTSQTANALLFSFSKESKRPPNIRRNVEWDLN